MRKQAGQSLVWLRQAGTRVQALRHSSHLQGFVMWEMSQQLGSVEESLHPARESSAHEQRRGNLIVHLGWGKYCQKRARHLNGWLELHGVPGGICLRKSSLLSGTVWLCCFKILLWALLEEITPLGQRSSGRCYQLGVAWLSCKYTTTCCPTLEPLFFVQLGSSLTEGQDAKSLLTCAMGVWSSPRWERRAQCCTAGTLWHQGSKKEWVTQKVSLWGKRPRGKLTYPELSRATSLQVEQHH